MVVAARYVLGQGCGVFISGVAGSLMRCRFAGGPHISLLVVLLGLHISDGGCAGVSIV